MRPLLAITWDHQELVCLVGMRTKKGLRIDSAHLIQLDETTSFADAAVTLAKELSVSKRHSFDLLIAMPRTQVEVSQLTLPPASNAELPGLVRNELARLHPEVNDSSLIDFHASHGSTDGGAIQVEAALVRDETHQDIQSLSAALRSEPTRIMVRYHAVASLFARQVKKLPRASLLLNMMHGAVDISVLHDDRIQFTRSIHLSRSDDDHLDVAHLSDEIRRTMFVAPLEEGGELLEARHVYMFAALGADDQLVEDLAEDLQLPVSLLDPLAGIELSGERPITVHRLASLIGMMWDYVDGQAPIDFANPKEPPPPARVGRRVAIYSIAVVVTLFAVGWILKGDVDQAKQRVATLKRDVTNNNQLLEKIRKQTIVLDAVRRWEQNEINWLDELRRISDQLPGPDQAVLKRITMAPAPAGRGIVSLSVRVRDPERIAELEIALRDASHQVNSQRISAAGASEDQFGVAFETRVVVDPTQTTTVTESDATDKEPS